MSSVYVQTIGAGKPLVLVHGWAMHSGIWSDFATELAQYHQLILVDLPGHGRSAPIVPFMLKTISKQLTEAIDLESCCWLGWSLGAQVVLQIAADFPERVKKLIIMAGTPCFVSKNDWPGMAQNVLENFAELLRMNGEETLLRFLLLQVKDSDDAKKVLKTLKAIVFGANFPDEQTLQGGLNILKTTDLRPVMANLTQPVCAILGTHDALVPAAAGQAMQHLLPSMQLHLLQRAGHTPFLTHSRYTVDLVRQFLDA